jgi:quercetin dioxygenase-like cupin family protein
MSPDSLKKKLKKEGFAHVYEWTDEPHTKYPKHSHKGRVSFYVTRGSIDVDMDGDHMHAKAGDRVNVRVGAMHSAKVGSGGCTFIVGEEIKGDS